MEPTVYRLNEYEKPSFFVQKIDLILDINPDKTVVTSKLYLERNKIFKDKRPLVLNGVDLHLKSLHLNGQVYSDYQVFKDNLELKTDLDQFELETVVEINPAQNFSCEGFYQSGPFFCTQCEAEGFRKITYYIDRPDVMASFTTTLIADKKTFPVLLSNGNLLEKKELADGRHLAKWHDPFLKPSYLFAAVAGELAIVKDFFVTKSGRKVALEIYVDKGNEDKCAHAMESLKKSMRWDETRFNLEYDLDIYMIVATDTFNMGAMENKGLNIFNSAYVLAKPSTATDHDFVGIESVIGHEYFHNWTGNRVTCRDWFQLTLKEGLTVFRDQEFSSDLNSRALKRIENVQALRSMQFPEDQGPMSHPIQPKSYIEINNFYTATVYEKGSEVIRMIHTLLGEKKFQKGMALYFERHDGMAVTTQDFVRAMQDASGIDLSQFEIWYDQNGTPKLKIDFIFDEASKIVKIRIEQVVKTNHKDRDALHMPFNMAFFARDGKKIKTQFPEMVELKDKVTEFTINGVMEKPIPSWNRNFTAPVIVDYNYSLEELAHLLVYESDEFNRFDAAQNFYIFVMKKEYTKLGNGFDFGAELDRSIKGLLTSKIDAALLGMALALPAVIDIAESIEKPDFVRIHQLREALKKHIGHKFSSELLELYRLHHNASAGISGPEMGSRLLKNICLDYLMCADNANARLLAQSQFINARNMTDEIEALSALMYLEHEREEALRHFYKRWHTDKLVLQKWVRLIAMSDREDILKVLAQVESDPAYDAKIPNFLRASVASFAMKNPAHFHAHDGSGYDYVCKRIKEIDAYNPQVAARLCKSFASINHLDSKQKELMRKSLTKLLESTLSNDSFEVVTKMLNS